MANQTLLTLEQFYAMPESECCKVELDRGELITMPPQPWKHEGTKNRIAELLIVFLHSNRLGKAHSETGYEVDGESWRKPDVSFVKRERLTGLDKDKPFPGAPDLAVEVVSRSESKRSLARKTQHLLEAGTSVVWLVYPDTQEINIVRKTGDEWLGIADTIDEPDLLPGFTAQVSSFFSDEP